MIGVSPEHAPNPFTLMLEPDISRLVDEVEAELAAKAQIDPDKCCGYFPSLNLLDGIDQNLPNSRAFHEALPVIDVGRRLDFNFLRLSLAKQPELSPFHIDSDATTALTGDVASLGNRLVWRAMLNLSSEAKQLVYSRQSPTSLPLTSRGGYLQCADGIVDKRTVKTAIIPPRDGVVVEGVIFCANRVLHSGRSPEASHFVVSYGVDEAL